MKALRNITLGVVGLVAGYYLFGYVWVMFWDVLMKIFNILQTIIMVGIVMTAIYVLWNMLSYKSTKERDY
jgi:predicted membrane protein